MGYQSQTTDPLEEMMTSVIERFKRMTESIHALRNQQAELNKNHVTGKIKAIASRWARLYRINSFSSLKYLGKANHDSRDRKPNARNPEKNSGRHLQPQIRHG